MAPMVDMGMKEEPRGPHESASGVAASAGAPVAATSAEAAPMGAALSRADGASVPQEEAPSSSAPERTATAAAADADGVGVLAENPDPEKIRDSLTFYPTFYSNAACTEIEAQIDDTARRGKQGLLGGPRTIDETPARTKYFFGHGYTYGRGMRGFEELLPTGSVAPIPEWVRTLVIGPLEQRGVIPAAWVDSVVLNDYRAGSSIVAHVDPPRLFARPIVTVTFFCPARLVFGASFDPARRVPPAHAQLLTRGSVLLLDGYAANSVTHGIRPEDILGTRRVSLILRHVIAQPAKVPTKAVNAVSTASLALICKAQGLWRSPASAEAKVPGRFYLVRGTNVAVLDGDAQPDKQPPSAGRALQGRVATWQLVPADDAVICNGGLLDEDGVSDHSLRWRMLRNSPQHAKQCEDPVAGTDASPDKSQPPYYTWLRAEN